MFSPVFCVVSFWKNTGLLIDYPTLSSLGFANDNWLLAVVLFSVGALVFLLISYRRSPLRGWPRWVAMLLKGSGLILLAFSLLEPVWLDEMPKKGGNDLVILADNSRGLAIQQPGEDKPLGREMQEALQGDSEDVLPDWMAKLSDTFRLQTYVFDRRLKRSGNFTELDLSGNASTVLTSLRSVRNRYARRAHAGTVIFTDGNATDSESIDSVLQELGEAAAEGKPVAPVFPVVVGQQIEGASDLAIDAISVSKSAFEDAPVTISVSAQARGDLRAAELFAIDEKGKEVHVEPVAFPDREEEGIRESQVRMKIATVPEGISFYRIGIRHPKGTESPPKELTTENDQRIVSVDRGRGPYRILYVSGRPNWEYKFIRRSIAKDSEIDLVGLIRIAKREPKFEWRGRTGESSNPLFRGFNSDVPEETQKYDEPVLVRLNTKTKEELRDGFPKSAEQLFLNYRAIVLDDVEAEFFSQEQMDLLDRFVSQRGGTVVMLGGQESFQQGKWNNTAVGRMLPVYLDQTGRGGPSLYATYNLSREGWLEPWMRLRGTQTDEETRLAYMPEFFSVNQIQAIKPGASILATITDSRDRRLPALITQRYGEGKTAALTIGDMWRWGMRDPELQEDLAKSWRQLLRWAVVEVPGRVTLETQSVSDGTLPVTEVTARVRDREFRPQDDASVKFEVAQHFAKTEEGEKPEPRLLNGEPSLEEAGVFSTRHFADEEGGFRLKATTRDGEGKVIAESESGWALNPAAEEFRSIGPNRDLLEQIANATGGKVFEIGQLDQLVTALSKLEVPVLEIKEKPLWHTPWFFLLALLCFLGEWGLRRWKGIL